MQPRNEREYRKMGKQVNRTTDAQKYALMEYMRDKDTEYFAGMTRDKAAETVSNEIGICTYSTFAVNECAKYFKIDLGVNAPINMAAKLRALELRIALIEEAMSLGGAK